MQPCGFPVRRGVDPRDWRRIGLLPGRDRANVATHRPSRGLTVQDPEPNESGREDYPRGRQFAFARLPARHRIRKATLLSSLSPPLIHVTRIFAVDVTGPVTTQLNVVEVSAVLSTDALMVSV